MFKALTPKVLRSVLPLLKQKHFYKFPINHQPIHKSFQAPLFVQYFSSDVTPKTLIQQAYDALDSSNVQKAQSDFQSALNLISKQSPENFEEKAQALVGLASLYTILGQHDQAISSLQNAEQALKQSDVEDKTVLSHLCYLLARNYRQINNLDEALKYAERSIQVQKETSDEEGSKLGLMYYNLGAIYRQKGELEPAKTNLVKAVECFEKEGSQDDPQLSFLTYELGQVLLHKQEFPEALKYLKKADQVFKSETNVRQTFRAEINYHLGIAYEGCQDMDNAIEYYINTYEIASKPFEDVADKENMAKLLEAIGMRMMEVNRADDAIDPLQRALELFGEVEAANNGQSANGENIAMVCHYLGLAHASNGDIETGILFLEKALELKSKVFGQDHAEVGFAHQSLGAAYCSVNKLQESVEQLDKALSILAKHFGESHPVCQETIETRKQALSRLQ